MEAKLRNREIIRCNIIGIGMNFVLSLIKIVGERADPEYRRGILNLLLAEEGVLNVYNLVLHNYGEKIYFGSVDIEVDENMPASAISRLSRRLIRIAGQAGLTLTNVGINAVNTSDLRADEIWDTVIETAVKYDSITGVNSFVVDFDEKIISFYAILGSVTKKSEKDLQAFSEELETRFGDMSLEILEIREM